MTSYGYTSNCRYIDGHQRVDIPVVQDWLLPIMSGEEPVVEPPVDNVMTSGKGKGNGNGGAHGNEGANGNDAVRAQGEPGKAIGHSNTTGRDAEHAARG